MPQPSAHRTFASNTNRVAVPRTQPSHQQSSQNPSEVASHVDDSAPQPDVDSAGDDAQELPNETSTTISTSCSHALATLTDLEALALHQLHANYLEDFRLAQQQRLQQAQEAYLKAKLDTQIVQKAKTVRGKYFGWDAAKGHWWERTEQRTDGGWIPFDHRDSHIQEDRWAWSQETADEKWGVLRDVEAHQFLLEDPEVKERFFGDLERLWLRDDVRGLPEEGRNEGDINFIPDQRRLGWMEDSSAGHSAEQSPKKSTRLIIRGAPKLQTMEKTSARKRLEEDLAKEEAAVREAIHKKFKANSVPASSIIPRYARIMHQMGTKSAEVRAQRAAELTSQIHPFKFLVDDESRIRESCRCRSRLYATIDTALQEVENAKNAEERMKRRLASSLAMESRLVTTAGDEGRKRREKLIKNESKAGLTAEHRFHPEINHAIPDYREQYSQFKRSLAMRKEMREVTIPEPFPSVEKHHKEGSKLSKLRNRSKSWDRAGSPSSPMPKFKVRAVSYNAHPVPRPRPTHSFLLKKQQREIERQAEELIERVQKAETKEKQEERKRIAKKVRSRLHMEIRDKHKEDRERRVRFVEAQQQRDEVYRRQLEEINDRIDGKLCLFEQTEVFNAKIKAKSDFKEIVTEGGLKIQDYEDPPPLRT
ncbi:hypothetical protein HDV00_002473 [Rhizophlyctis rosea]|nr:hypothetical protein HDV00_002473 [Rhizophlyctis rosea]